MSRVLPSIKRVVPLYGEIRVSETAFPPIACLSMYIETTYFAPNIYRIRIIERVISFLLSSFSFFCGIIDIALSVSSYNIYRYASSQLDWRACWKQSD